MTTKSIGLAEPLYRYLIAHGAREPAVLAALREETASHPMVRMQISPDQGALMAMLVRLVGARRCLEVGVFTGYSSLAVALALPADGSIVACDVNEEWTDIARRYWQQAGVANKIDLQLRPALETLDSLLSDGAAGTFDFAFIDADKTSYEAYVERALELLRPGGLIVVDNVLWGGSVVDADNNEADTEAIRAFNARRVADERVDLVMLPVADGVTLLRKR